MVNPWPRAFGYRYMIRNGLTVIVPVRVNPIPLSAYALLQVEHFGAPAAAGFTSATSVSGPLSVHEGGSVNVYAPAGSRRA